MLDCLGGSVPSNADYCAQSSGHTMCKYAVSSGQICVHLQLFIEIAFQNARYAPSNLEWIVFSLAKTKILTEPSGTVEN